jgi:hypothetical protein
LRTFAQGSRELKFEKVLVAPDLMEPDDQYHGEDIIRGVEKTGKVTNLLKDRGFQLRKTGPVTIMTVFIQ